VAEGLVSQFSYVRSGQLLGRIVRASISERRGEASSDESWWIARRRPPLSTEVTMDVHQVVFVQRTLVQELRNLRSQICELE
jgi:hypothetical protein